MGSGGVSFGSLYSVTPGVHQLPCSWFETFFPHWWDSLRVLPPNTALMEVCPPAQTAQESHFVCVSCGVLCIQFPPLHAGSAWHAARTSGLWWSMTSANTAQGGDGLKPPEQLWLLGWSESSFRRSAPWHAWSQLVGRVSQKLASSKCSKSKRIWFYSLSNPIISACNVKDSVIQQFYFFPAPLLQMEHPNKV